MDQQTTYSSQQNQIEGLWYDMVPDELILGWQDEFMRELNEGIVNNNSHSALPKISRKTE